MNSERQTRQQQIDLQLGRAGWAVGSRRLVEEFLVETASELREPEGAYQRYCGLDLTGSSSMLETGTSLLMCISNEKMRWPSFGSILSGSRIAEDSAAMRSLSFIALWSRTRTIC